MNSLLLLYGNEIYDIDRNKVSFIQQGEKNGEETESFDNDFLEAYSYVNTPTFFSLKKRAIVVIDSLDVLKSDPVKEYLEEAKARTAAGFILLVYSKSIDAKKMKYLSELEKEGGLMLLPCVKAKNAAVLKTRIEEFLAEDHVIFDPDALELFIDRLDYLKNEEINLVTYRNYICQLKYIAHERSVSVKDVEEIVPDLREGNQYALAKLIVTRNANAISKEIEKLLRTDDADVFTILGSLFREYRMAYKFNKGFDLKVIKDKPPYIKPTLSVLSISELLNGMSIISNCLASVRMGTMDEENALKFCIASLCTTKGTEKINN